MFPPWRGAITLAFAATLVAGAVHAEPTAAGKETARALAEQGDDRFAAHDFPAALKLYAAAHKTMGVPTTGVRLARAQEALNLLVEARDTFLAVTRFPEQPGEPAVFTSARAEARREADALASRIPSVVVKVTGLPEGVAPAVHVDDEPLPPEASTLPHKVNPGKHHIAASAPGFRTGAADVTLREGEVGRAEIVLAAATPAEVTTPEPVRAPTPVPELHGGGLRTASYVLAGAGVVGLGVGAAFGVDALSKKNARSANCNAQVTVCNQAGIDADSQGRSSATASTIAFAAGAVGVGAGVVLWLVSRKPDDTRTGAMVLPAVGSNGGGVVLQGVW
jgi:hypothetical protein